MKDALLENNTLARKRGSVSHFKSYYCVIQHEMHNHLVAVPGYVARETDACRTVGKKSIRALEIVLAIFLCFECQFLSFYACYKEYKA